MAEYAYGGMNRRTVKKTYVSGSLSETRDFYYSDQWQVIEERVTISAVRKLERQFIWGLRYVDDLILRETFDTTSGSMLTRIYACQDANYNVVALTDASGAVTQRFKYDAYGNSTALDDEFAPDTNNEWETRYAGYRWDRETGLYQVRMRFLHNFIGRWTTRDRGPHKPNNFYRYTSARPTTATDPSGLLANCEVDGGTAIVIFWIEYVPGFDPLLNSTANPEPPGALSDRATKGARRRHRQGGVIVKSIGEILGSKEFRNIHILQPIIKCCNGTFDSVVRYGNEQHVGYTPQPGTREAGAPVYLQGTRGKPKISHKESRNSKCVTITSRQYFRVNLFENIGQAQVSGFFLPFASSTIVMDVCCDGEVAVSFDGTSIPSYSAYYDGTLLEQYSMNSGNGAEANLRDFQNPLGLPGPGMNPVMPAPFF